MSCQPNSQVFKGKTANPAAFVLRLVQPRNSTEEDCRGWGRQVLATKVLPANAALVASVQRLWGSLCTMTPSALHQLESAKEGAKDLKQFGAAWKCTCRDTAPCKSWNEWNAQFYEHMEQLQQPTQPPSQPSALLPQASNGSVSSWWSPQLFIPWPLDSRYSWGYRGSTQLEPLLPHCHTFISIYCWDSVISIQCLIRTG